MQKFKLVIQLGNDAMSTAQDIAGALRTLADKLGTDDYNGVLAFDGVVVDDNGNKVGSWAID